jgi:hypothetical protein
MKYRVSTADNFHYMDASEHSEEGVFSSAQEAIEVAQQIVERSLRHLYQHGFTPARLYDEYQDFGDDPFIVSDDQKCRFSAWTYAESRCAAICEELAAATHS